MTITKEQLKFRAGKIGASSMAQAVGYGFGKRTRAALYHYMKGNTPADKETMAMRVGNFMETFILDEYNILTNRGGVAFPDTLIHEDEPRIICHCDGITTKTVPTRLIEIKNVGPRMKDAWKDGVPNYVHIQACGQSMLAGIKDVDVVAYFGGNDLEVFELSFTNHDHSLLYDGLKDFLSYVDKNEEPPHVQADLPMLATYFDYQDVGVEATDGIIAEATLLAKLKKESKVTANDKAAIDELEFKVKEFMGDKSVLHDNAGNPLFTWKRGKGKEVVDWEGLAMQLFQKHSFQPATIEEYKKAHTTTKTATRTFLCKIK